MKIPAAFAPKSWEMPPGFRVLEGKATMNMPWPPSVFTRDFDGEKLKWVVALVRLPSNDEIKWARPLDNRFDAGFIALGQGDYLYTDCISIGAPLSFSEDWEENEFARHFFLNQNNELRVGEEETSGAILVRPDGTATWTSLAQHMEIKKESMFRWGEPLTAAQFLRLPAMEVWKRLQTLPKNPDSEAIFARRFGAMSNRERTKLVFRSRRGPNKEIVQLLEVIARAEGIWDEVPEGKELHIHLDAIAEDEVLGWSGFGTQFVSSDPSLLADVMQLREWFFPMRQEFARHLCVQQWLEWNGGPHHLYAFIKPPTAHEQLEAALRWREWKANHEKL